MAIDGDFRFYVNIYGANGQGSGPLESVVKWRYTARLDRAGSIEFDYYASDPRAYLVTSRCTAQAFAWLNGDWIEIGWGIVEKTDTILQGDGRIIIRASGLDVVGEFGYRSVRNLEIGAGDGATLSEALATLDPYKPNGWIYVINNAPVNDYFYAKLDGESTLGTLGYIVDKLQTHFYRGVDRHIHFDHIFTNCGLHAVQASGEMDERACVITSLTRTVNTEEYQSLMYVTGTGLDRESSLTLAATDRVAPTGYVLNKAESWIANETAAGIYGYKDFPEVSFKSITPISNTDADYVAASNFLFDAALAELQRRSSMEAQETYTLTLANCNLFVRPMQYIRVTHQDPEQNFNVNADLNILEVTWEVDHQGPRTAGMVVSTHEYWPRTSDNTAAERVRQEKVFRTHPQSSLNEWWGYFHELVGDNQTDHMAAFHFVMGLSVMMVKQVVFRFKVEQALVLTKSYTLGDETVISDATPTGDATVTIDDADVVVAHDPAHGTLVSPKTGLRVTPNTTNPILSSPNYGLVDTVTNGALSTNPTTHFHAMNAAGHQHEHQHDHAVDDHYHDTLAEAEHLASPHSHTNTQHNHPQTPHAHGMPAFTESFGLSRVPALNTYVMADLEYAVNGGEFEPMELATGTGDGYFEFDITSKVTNPSLPFRPSQTSGNNLVEIRRKTAAAVGKSASIRVMLGVRSVIQAVEIS